jgi:hypothetical protein
MPQDGGRSEEGFELVEGELTVRGPIEGFVLLEEGGDRMDDTGVTIDEPAVEIRESEKHLDFVDILGRRPVGNGRNTVGIHRHTIGGDDKAQKGERGSMKFAFLEFAG